MTRKAAHSDEKSRKGFKITSSARNPLNKLPVKRRIYAAARATGATVASAAEEAGVSARMGSKYEKDSDIQQAYSYLLRKAVPAKKLIKLIAKGCEATMPVYGADGKKKKDRPDWKSRRPYIDMVREDGKYVDKKADGNATMIAVTVQHVGQRQQPKTIVLNGEQTKSLPETTAQAD